MKEENVLVGSQPFPLTDVSSVMALRQSESFPEFFLPGRFIFRTGLRGPL